MALGFIHYGKGREQVVKGNYAPAIEHFERSRSTLDAFDNPFMVRALYSLGCAEHFASYESAFERLSQAKRQAEDEGYLSLEAESAWMRGLSRFNDDELTDAAEMYREAFLLFERLEDIDGAAGAANLLAETLDRQGDFEGAWSQRLYVLRSTRLIGNAQRLYQIYATAAISAFAQGYVPAALLFQDESVRQARHLQNPEAVAHALCWRARYRHRAGHASTATADLAEAELSARSIGSPSASKNALVSVLLAQAELVLGGRPSASLDLLDQALLYARESDNIYHLTEIYWLRARSWIGLGRMEAARGDLERSIHVIEDRRGKINDSIQRLLFLETKRAAFDEMISIELALGRADEALGYLERRRARDLLDLAFDADIPAVETTLDRAKLTFDVGSKEIAQQVTPEVALLSYAEVGDRVLIWVTERSGTLVVQSSADAVEFRRALRRFRLAAQRGDSDFRENAEAAWKYVIGPIERHLHYSRHLVFSVDPSLAGVPFAAMIDSRGRYLLESFEMSVVPSCAAYLISLGRSARLDNTLETALFVGDPAFDGAVYPRLSRLPAAQEEVLKASRLYSESVVLLDKRATKETFFSRVRGRDVIQISSHIIDRKVPLWSSIIMAPSSTRAPDADGVVHGFEIYSSDAFSQTSLVVLAGCGSLDVESSGAIGTESLARAFFAAGAANVVGTLWSIPDADSSSLLTSFHMQLQAGLEPAAALRKVQLQLLRWDGEQLLWAAFSVYGAGAGGARNQRA